MYELPMIVCVFLVPDRDCSIANGGCAHICINGTNSTEPDRCSCYNGYLLSNDTTDCIGTHA